jgi:hypothetical protein
MGKLMTEPRNKGDKEAGNLSETALTLVKSKAVERVIGRPLHTPANFSMKRGTLLEHAACYLLSVYWDALDACTWMPIGDNAGATPDFLKRDNSPGDIKCKESEAEIFDFATEVSDWDSLLAFNKDEAWQIATQALAAGTTKATLIYFTDKVAAVHITDEEFLTCNAIMETMGQKLFDLTGQIYDYRYNSNEGNPGFMFVARTIDIPTEAFDRIRKVIARAEQECQAYVKQYEGIYHGAPSVEEVEAVSDLIEDADIETEEAHDIGELETLVDYLLRFPPMDLKTAQAQHTMGLVRKRLNEAVDMITGTINKDLR